MMNKKGAGPLIIVGIIIGIIYLLFAISSSIKIGNAISIIPKELWYGFIAIILYLIFRGRK